MRLMRGVTEAEEEYNDRWMMSSAEVLGCVKVKIRIKNRKDNSSLTSEVILLT